MNEGIARRPARRWPLFIGLAILALTVFAIPVAAKSGGQSDLAGARNATARFHNLDHANAAGYSVRVADVNGITCIDNPGTGAMGVHYLDPGLVPELFDETAAASVDASTPELLVFEPGTNGHERLVALEYLTIKGPWDAQHAGDAVAVRAAVQRDAAPNRFGLPAFYSLHAWIWAPNPTDMFSPWNPRVTCP